MPPEVPGGILARASENYKASYCREITSSFGDLAIANQFSDAAAASVVDLGFRGGQAHEGCGFQGFTLFVGKFLDFVPEALNRMDRG